MEAGGGTWRVERLGPPADDRSVIGVADSDTVVVLHTTERGEVVGWVSEKGGAFVRGEPSEAGSEGLVLADAVPGPEGFLAVGNDFVSGLPVVLHSDDGRRWVRVATSGLDQRADVAGIAATDGGFVAVGALRTGAVPSMEPSFAPAVWHSSDGGSWTVEPLAVTSEGEGGVRGVVAVDGALVAVGQSGDEGTVWRSTDAGATWQASRVDLGDQTSGSVWLQDIAVVDGTLVAVGQSDAGGGFSRPLIGTSDDGGDSWSRVGLEDATTDGLEIYGLEGGPGRVFVLGSRFLDAYASPERCYTDLDACASDADPVVLTSSDGTDWDELDLSRVSDSEYLAIHDVVVTSPGSIFLIGVDEQVTAWTWPEESGPPLTTTPPSPPATNREQPLATHGDQLEPGVTYRYPLYIHCGMGYLGKFNGTHWYLSDAPAGTPETGAGHVPPDNWPVAQQTVFGLITLVAEDRIEYSIPSGDVIAVYAPSDREPAGCA